MRNFFLLFILVVATIFNCTNYTNPFEDPTNVNMVIDKEESSILNLSPIAIFSTQTLVLYGTVQDEIDSFTIIIDKNRFWQDTTIISPIQIDAYIFDISVYDTGSVNLQVLTYRSNGDIIEEKLVVSATSPLVQQPIQLQGNLSCTLSTPAVSDQVFYTWYFGKNYLGDSLIYTYMSSTNPIALPDVDRNRTDGVLWVSDADNFRSPPVSFSYSYIDTTPPIVIYRDSIINDTVITGDTTFWFELEINDLGWGVDVAQINGADFYQNNGFFYVSILENMHLYQSDSAFNVSVYARDKNDNDTIRNFYIRFDADLPQSDEVNINLVYPLTSNYSTANDTISVVVDVENRGGISLQICMFHAETDSIIKIDTIIGSTTSQLVNGKFTLETGSNNIIVYAINRDNLSDTLAELSSSITKVNTTTVDTIPPAIHGLRLNDNSIVLSDEIYALAADTASLEVICYDDIDSVIINDIPKQSVQPNIWTHRIFLTGVVQFFDISLIDNSGNRSRDTIYVERNHKPVLNAPQSWPRTLVIGKPWYDTVIVSDIDGDSVEITHTILSGSFNFKNVSSNAIGKALFFKQFNAYRWAVVWNGGIGLPSEYNREYQSSIMLSDGKQTVSQPWRFRIADSTNAIDYVLKLDWPDNIDTNKFGAVDLSQLKEPIEINGEVIGDAVQLEESDEIIISFPDQVITTSNPFTVTFNPIKKKSNETMIVSVVSGDDTIFVDSIQLIYTYRFPLWTNEENPMIHLSSADSVQTDWLRRGNPPQVISWESISDKDWRFSYNSNIALKLLPEDVDSALPFLIEDGYLDDIPVIRFEKKRRANLLNTKFKWFDDKFTIFIAAKLNSSTSIDSNYVLVSQNGSYESLGLGVSKGMPASIISKNTSATNSFAFSKSPTGNLCDGDFHIYVFSSAANISGRRPIINMWLDGQLISGTSGLIIDNANNNLPYAMIGAGEKHVAKNAWDGDITEIVQFYYITKDSERIEMEKYLASKYKVKLVK